MVSYTSVHMTPAIYRGKHTDHSQDPLIADQPRRAPQLNVSPKNTQREKSRKIVTREPRPFIYRNKYYLFKCISHQQHQLSHQLCNTGISIFLPLIFKQVINTSNLTLNTLDIQGETLIVTHFPPI